MKIKDLFTDFFILITVFLIISAAFALGHRFLFGNEKFFGTLIIESEEMADLYSSYLNEGDILYDTQTKRRIGVINSLEVEKTKAGKIKFILEVEAQRAPKGSALRSDKLWFTYRTQDG